MSTCPFAYTPPVFWGGNEQIALTQAIRTALQRADSAYTRSHNVAPKGALTAIRLEERDQLNELAQRFSDPRSCAPKGCLVIVPALGKRTNEDLFVSISLTGHIIHTADKLIKMANYLELAQVSKVVDSHCSLGHWVELPIAPEELMALDRMAVTKTLSQSKLTPAQSTVLHIEDSQLYFEVRQGRKTIMTDRVTLTELIENSILVKLKE